MKGELIKRFGADRVIDVPVQEGQIPLLMLDLELASPVNVLLTNGLNSNKMNLPENANGSEYIELFFCLPSYWEWEDTKNPNTNWVFDSIQRLAEYMLTKETWFGHGHTMPANEAKGPISSMMKEDNFLLIRPMLLERELAPVTVDDKLIEFLAIVPIFYDEWVYKQSKGTVKLIKKMINKGVNEKLDDFRESLMKSRWRPW